ncbi:MAG: energy-coupling factor transporter transmembrane component T [Slackia sp.]|nr:energy-coupling factor transporter transmembrane component T [Slackia sp.]
MPNADSTSFHMNASSSKAPSEGEGFFSRCRLVDPRIAIIVVFAYSIALFVAQSWVAMGVLALALAAVLAAARVDVAKMLKGLIPLFVILAFTVLAHIPQGIGEGLYYALRILLLALATLAVAFSYDDMRLVRAFASFLSPLRALHVPVDDIATMFSIAVRFIPVSMDEFQRVSNAQRARGARFDEGGIIERVKCWGSVLVPILIGLFHRAGVLAQAMEARCYGGAHRTSLHGDEKVGAFGVFAAVAASVACMAVAFVL